MSHSTASDKSIAPSRAEQASPTEPVATERPPRLPFPVIGIGASAGGLEAFTDFFKSMRSDSGMAFVLIQHLPPDRPSMVADILGKQTEMKVYEVKDKMPVEANCVYVIRPGRTLTIKDGKLHLGQPLSTPGNNRAVDDFFRSLAEEQRERAICVIMSGMGSNGSAGSMAVKAVGGLVIAQDPDSAKFPSMPRSLIDSGQADLVLRPEDIPDALIRYARHPYASGGGAMVPVDGEKHHFMEILTILRSRTRKDFSGYKKPTVMRRVQRRMDLTQTTTLGDYVKILRQTPLEASALADDLLIHVTGFFRDPDAWEALRARVIEPMVAERDANTPLRCWVAACSSGEEAYSLAMLLAEASEAAGKEFDIKIFATDTADRTLSQARNGIFPGGIEGEISPARLERFFDKDDSVYRIKRELRELVVFAPQNIVQDPPFSRIDICSCRNLLIYLEPEMQTRILSLIHFGLREGGALFLGNSETVNVTEEMFEPVDKKWRIFRRIGPTRHGSLEFPSLGYRAGNGDRDRVVGTPSRVSVNQVTTKLLFDHYTPAAVAVDHQHRILFFHGNTSPFLDQPRGEPTRDLLLVAREQVRGAIRAALHKAATDNAPATVRDGTIETLAGIRRVHVTAAPLDLKSAPGHFLVTFQVLEESPTAPAPRDAAQVDNVQLQEELQRAREELQSTIEELQTSNEELRASNEELTSVNEEFQSTNEELETSKEELQSLNEELTTVNAQLQSKIDEQLATSNDLSSLLSSTAIAVIFLDMSLRIRRFTPAVQDLFELIPSDLGRPLNDLAKKFSDPSLLPDCQAVIDKLIPVEKEVPSESERWYLRRVLPYRTSENRIAGVVITFLDITQRLKSEREYAELFKREQRAREQAESATRLKDEFFAILGHELRTPLSAILLWVKMLREKNVTAEELREGLESISRSAEAQNQLVEELLDTARIAAGKLRLELRETDLTALVQGIAKTIEPIAQAKELDFKVACGSDIGVVVADGARLRQILWNLLTNAIKFTPAGGRVEIGLWRHGDGVEIRVADTGVGIAPKFQPHLFEAFRQAETTSTRSHGGLGLGLAISKQLVELHGGSLRGESAGEGQGATFIMRLPLRHMQNPARVLDAKLNSSGGHKDETSLIGRNILLVEDDVETRHALAKLLLREGAKVTAVECAKIAFDTYRRHAPDLIVSDIGLPDLDGCALLQMIRNLEKSANTPTIPAVALTAFIREEDRQKVLAAGFQFHISKPVEPDKFLAILRTIPAKSK